MTEALLSGGSRSSFVQQLHARSVKEASGSIARRYIWLPMFIVDAPMGAHARTVLAELEEQKVRCNGRQRVAHLGRRFWCPVHHVTWRQECTFLSSLSLHSHVPRQRFPSAKLVALGDMALAALYQMHFALTSMRSCSVTSRTCLPHSCVSAYAWQA